MRDSTVRLTGVLVLLGLVLGASAAAARSFDEAMQPVIGAYLEIHAALAADSTEGVKAAAKRILAAVPGLRSADRGTGEEAQQLKEVPAQVEEGARAVLEASGLDAVRDAFRRLSAPIAAWAILRKPEGLLVAFCPMARGTWVQPRGEIENPYFGPRMLHCGHVVGQEPEGCRHRACGGGEGCGHEERGGCSGEHEAPERP